MPLLLRSLVTSKIGAGAFIVPADREGIAGKVDVRAFVDAELPSRRVPRRASSTRW